MANVLKGSWQETLTQLVHDMHSKDEVKREEETHPEKASILTAPSFCEPYQSYSYRCSVNVDRQLLENIVLQCRLPLPQHGLCRGQGRCGQSGET